jgi:peptidoglycan hydrolase CwlO-like protein
MIQINLITINQFLKKHLGWIVAGALLLMMFNCQPDTSFARKQRDKENKLFEKKIDSLQNANKSKDKIIAKSEKKVAEKEKSIKSLNSKIVSLTKKGNEQIAKAKDYNLKDWKKFYQEKTGYGDKEIQIDGTAIKMTREPLVSIGTQLIKADVVRAELKLTKDILSETQTIVKEKDKIIENQDGKLVNLQSIIDSKDQIEDNLVKNISDLEKDLKKANRPKAKTIIISAVLGGIAGALLAK